MAGNILIIDDEAVLRQTFTRILKQAGHEVTTAADGAEALKRLEATRFDLAFLDIHLPGGMDGIEVLKQISETYPFVSVILFTGNASLQTAIDAVRLGATDYLVKPVSPDVLLERTKAVIKQQSLLRRRRELLEHIAALQEELRQLDASPNNPPSPTAQFDSERYLKTGPLLVDLQTRRATFGEQILTLPPATFDYLVVLARHTPDIVPYQTLVNEAQGYHTDPRQAQELAKWHIHEIRRALEPDSRRPRHIINERGEGYRLIVD
jgi:DNA-binding response OmpR family regulator